MLSKENKDIIQHGTSFNANNSTAKTVFICAI